MLRLALALTAVLMLALAGAVRVARPAATTAR
jgi:hypothetical protein